MKDFWVDLFCDLETIDKEFVADCSSTIIGRDLQAIEDAIRDYDLIKALAIIEDCKKYY